MGIANKCLRTKSYQLMASKEELLSLAMYKYHRRTFVLCCAYTVGPVDDSVLCFGSDRPQNHIEWEDLVC